MFRPIPLLALLFLLNLNCAQAQDDLMDMLEEKEIPTADYTSATFKGTRVISGHSIETTSGGVLEFMISHRFGRVNSGSYEFFGLDNATLRLGFTYGITDRLAVGIGRSSLEKTYDGYLKYRLLRQQSGVITMPVSVTLFASTAINTLKFPNPQRDDDFSSRLYYTYQALIARKFSDKLSLQLSPTLVHRNLVQANDDQNDVFAMGMSGRQKLTRSLSLNVEYYYVYPGQIESDRFGERVTNALSVGVDIETGGHVFQLHLTNSRAMIEKMFITETTGQWGKGDIHFGFNISRVFTLDRPKDFE